MSEVYMRANSVKLKRIISKKQVKRARRLLMNKTWVVQCPEKHGWSLSTEELERVKNDYFVSNLKCVPCESSFSLWQGVKEAYLGYLLSDFFVDNSRETGTIDVEVGKALWVTFAMPFEDNPKVSLTPQFNVHAA